MPTPLAADIAADAANVSDKPPQPAGTPRPAPPRSDAASDAHPTGSEHGAGLAALTLAALGVVYGDIGTSPLYTVGAIFAPETGIPLDAAHLVGAVSTIFWALMLVVTLKYVLLVLRADNRGEGGILALAALAGEAVRERPSLRMALLSLGVFGATLFYGDSVITPAISVLGAVEGLEVIAPSLKTWVVPISLGVLFALFAVQRFGTGAVGRVFGPVIALWFATLAVTGLVQIARQPAILAALNPVHAAAFVIERGWQLFAAVGAIVLAITGAEALYADMGHFGARPIRIAWTALVLPALALNYMGQGALLLADPSALANPFYRLFPAGWVPAVLLLATFAAIIASQAVISGAYSMTRQAIQLGYLPRLTVRFTSARHAGQVYLPFVNTALLAGVFCAVLVFGSATGLAGAYGIAVTITMGVTTLLTWFVVRDAWRVPSPIAGAATLLFIALDGVMVASCATKFLDGGWFPLLFGGALFVVMSTWSAGRGLLREAMAEEGLELLPFIEALEADGSRRASRTAVYVVGNAERVPHALLHNMKHNQVLHERNVIVRIEFHDVPRWNTAERVEVVPLEKGFWRVTLHFGFLDTPDVPAALIHCDRQGLTIPAQETSYFLSRETVVPTAKPGMARWREHLFAAIHRNAGSVAQFLRLPDNAVVELGTRVQI